MVTRTGVKSICLVFLAVLLISCNLTSLFNKDANEDEASSAETAPTELMRSEEGGFEFEPIKEFTTTESYGWAEMLAPGANEETGPLIMIIGGVGDIEMDNEELFTKMVSESEDVEFSTPKKVRVDGIDALDVNFTSLVEGEDARARMVIAMVNSYQTFVMMGVAPTDQWKDLDKKFDRVLKSINFITPVVITSE